MPSRPEIAEGEAPRTYFKTNLILPGKPAKTSSKEEAGAVIKYDRSISKIILFPSEIDLFELNVANPADIVRADLLNITRQV